MPIGLKPHADPDGRPRSIITTSRDMEQPTWYLDHENKRLIVELSMLGQITEDGSIPDRFAVDADEIPHLRWFIGQLEGIPKES